VGLVELASRIEGNRGSRDVLGNVAARSSQMDDTCGGRCYCPKSVYMSHYIVSAFLLLDGGCCELLGCQVLFTWVVLVTVSCYSNRN